MSKGTQIALGAIAIAAIVGWYGYTNVDPYRYFQTLEEFQAEGTLGSEARVHGYVKPGSIKRDLATKSVRFAIVGHPPHAAQSTALPPLGVVYESLETPDLFKDGAEVVVEGRLVSSDAGGAAPHFQAISVLAKCPSKFEAKQVETRAS